MRLRYRVSDRSGTDATIPASVSHVTSCGPVRHKNRKTASHCNARHDFAAPRARTLYFLTNIRCDAEREITPQSRSDSFLEPSLSSGHHRKTTENESVHL